MIHYSNSKNYGDRRQKHGEHHPDVAMSYNDIGTILKAQGNDAEALQYFKKSMDTYTIVAKTLKQQGKESEAVPYIQKGIEIFKKK